MPVAVATPSDPSLKDVNFTYVVATHKGIQTTPSAAEQLKPVIGKDTVIVLIQNGVGVEEPFKAMYPNNTILSGVVSVIAAFKHIYHSLTLPPDCCRPG